VSVRIPTFKVSFMLGFVPHLNLRANTIYAAGYAAREGRELFKLNGFAANHALQQEFFTRRTRLARFCKGRTACLSCPKQGIEKGRRGTFVGTRLTPLPTYGLSGFTRQSPERFLEPDGACCPVRRVSTWFNNATIGKT
jgi:hypothetical protein